MVIVENKFSILSEANLMLYTLTKNFNYDEYKKDASISSFGEEMYIKMLNKIASAYKILEDKLDVSKEKIDFYFKPIAEDNLWSISDFVMLYDFLKYDETLDSNIERVKSISDEERLLEYAKRVTEYYSQGNIEDANKIHTLEDLINVLEEGEYSDGIKLAIINTFCNKDKYLNEVAEILRKAIVILEEFSSEYKFIEEFFYEYWTKFISEKDIIETIKKSLNIEWRHNPNGLIILPVLAAPNKYTISIPDEGKDDKDILRIGILTDENFRQLKKAANIDDISNIMKIFGDKSKLDILNMIKDKPAYGKELADGLGLAKGTISHHMSSLMSIGVIDTLCDSNKIYYSLNKKKFSEIMDELKEFFV